VTCFVIRLEILITLIVAQLLGHGESHTLALDFCIWPSEFKFFKANLIFIAGVRVGRV
jgi:hypothetical protein